MDVGVGRYLSRMPLSRSRRGITAWGWKSRNCCGSSKETSQSSGFTIRVPDTARVFLLKAPTFELMEKWITALRK
eukprot:1059849-Amorphochlora_amoeboformis.AAC.1